MVPLLAMLRAGQTDQQLGRLADLRKRIRGGAGGACADDGPAGAAHGMGGVPRL
jgi:hypothetical protein